jgi:TPR repeat protein
LSEYLSVPKNRQKVTRADVARLYRYSRRLIRKRGRTEQEGRLAFLANKLCASLGHRAAAFARMRFELHGVGIIRDVDGAHLGYLHAADRLETKAYYWIGYINELKGDAERAMDWYALAAKMGEKRAALRIARIALESAKRCADKACFSRGMGWLRYAISMGSERAKRLLKSR